MTIQVYFRNAIGELEPLENVEANTFALDDGALVLSYSGADASRRQRVTTVGVFADGEWAYAVEKEPNRDDA